MEGTDGELTFTHYPEYDAYIPTLREKIFDALNGLRNAKC
jgi:hypothetical protein